MLFRLVFVGICLVVSVGAFSVVVSSSPRRRFLSTALQADNWSSSSGSSSSSGAGGRIEQIEFKIFPDGRVEETVRGVKGMNCEKVTESINNNLGQVVATRPTEELYEQEQKVEQTLYESDWSSGGTW